MCYSGNATIVQTFDGAKMDGAGSGDKEWDGVDKHNVDKEC